MSNPSESTLWTPEVAAETRVWMRTFAFRPWFEESEIVLVGNVDPFAAKYASLLGASVTDAKAWKPDDGQSTAPFFYCPTLEAGDLAALAKQAPDSARLALGFPAGSSASLAEWQDRIHEAFPDRTVRYLVQSTDWPFRLVDSAPSFDFAVALVAPDELPSWPSLGFAMPTVDSPHEVREAILAFQRTYPGELRFAVVANGSGPESLSSLEETAANLPGIELIVAETNLGYGQGCNRGLDALSQLGGLDYLGVVNDDVVPDADCLGELVWGMKKLEALGLRPGAIGPVSNNIHGPQQVDIGQFQSYAELLDRALVYRQSHASSATQIRQLRGLCLVFHPQLVHEIGGFDPCFGLGNFEDDDHNLRAHLAGYTLWIADGAFLFHHGSTTFRRLQIDYAANIARNAETMAAKWKLESVEQWIGLNSVPRGVSLHVPLDAWKDRMLCRTVTINGEAVDLVQQASDLEFAAWMLQAMRGCPREDRRRIVDLLEGAAA